MGISKGATRALLGLRAAARPIVQQSRNFRYETVVSGPPRFPISTPERSFISASSCVYSSQLQLTSWQTLNTTEEAKVNEEQVKIPFEMFRLSSRQILHSGPT